MTNRMPSGIYKKRTAATVLPATKALERAEALDRALRILDLTKTDRDDGETPRKQVGCSSRSPIPPLMDILCEFPAIEWRFNGQADPRPDNVSNAFLRGPVRKLEKKQVVVSDMCQIKRANNIAHCSSRKAIKRKKISRKRLVRSRSFLSLASTEEQSQSQTSLVLRD